MISLILASNLIVQSVQLKESELRKLDTFASNFAEAATPSFKVGKASSSLMLDFALTHCLFNKGQEFAIQGDRTFVKRETLAFVIKRFFGTSIPITQKLYEVRQGDGDSLPESRVYKVFGSYPASFTMYCIDFISSQGAGEAVSGKEDAVLLRYVKLQAQKSGTENGRFVIKSLEVQSAAAWKRESGVRSPEFVRPGS